MVGRCREEADQICIFNWFDLTWHYLVNWKVSTWSPRLSLVAKYHVRKVDINQHSGDGLSHQKYGGGYLCLWSRQYWLACVSNVVELVWQHISLHLGQQKLQTQHEWSSAEPALCWSVDEQKCRCSSLVDIYLFELSCWWYFASKKEERWWWFELCGVEADLINHWSLPPLSVIE